MRLAQGFVDEKRVGIFSETSNSARVFERDRSALQMPQTGLCVAATQIWLYCTKYIPSLIAIAHLLKTH